MKSKQIEFESECRKSMYKGIEKLAKTVSSTLGPRGRNVVIEKQIGSPLITKDGVTVANEIYFKDRLENIGAQIVKQSAQQTNMIAGDGTTTATTLAASLIKGGIDIQELKENVSMTDIIYGMNTAKDFVIDNLQKIKQDITPQKLESVASISANNDPEIGSLLYKAIEKTGDEGFITIQESKNFESSVEIKDGLEYDRGFASPHFINDTKSITCEHNDVVVVPCNVELTKNNIASTLVPLLESLMHCNQSFLLIALDYDPVALQMIALNVKQKKINGVAIKAPGFNDQIQANFEDISVACGGSAIIDSTTDFSQLDITKSFGTAEKVIVGQHYTKIIGTKGNPDHILERVNFLKTNADQSHSSLEKERLQQRVARLTGGVAIIHLGASSEIEMQEKKARIEDALNATKAAIEQGIVAGGGVALFNISKQLDKLKKRHKNNEDIIHGIEIVRSSLTAPFKNIVFNAFGNTSNYHDVLKKILKSDNINFGWDAKNNNYGNMINMGIIDPVKVTITAIEKSVSVATTFLTTNSAIFDDVDDNTTYFPDSIGTM